MKANGWGLQVVEKKIYIGAYWRISNGIKRAIVYFVEKK